jgi:hypothetical protein
VAGSIDVDLKAAQTICCFFPPLALQIASGAFLNSYDGIKTSKIGGIMVLLLLFLILLYFYFCY